ncbi:MAG TPA: hypothetical protein VMU75_05560 [Acidimicrobiales bacterium]|nr:hypothetical protein [Acidimicrobiales bacterium]
MAAIVLGGRRLAPATAALGLRRQRSVPWWPPLLAAAYVVLGVLAASRGAVSGDALSRVVNADLVVAGTNPHFAAVGFVWGPLPSLIEAPLLLLFNGAIPGMLANGYAGVVMSSGFGAWLVWHVYRFVREEGAGPGWAAMLAAGVALNPMIVIYAISGMSEVPFLCTLVAALRHHVSWMREGRSSELAMAGCWLGAGYLIRYETLAAAVAAMVLTAGFSYFRAREAGMARTRQAIADALVFVIPVLVAFVLFTGISWWFTGQLFGEFSQEYGNPFFVRTLGAGTLPPSQVAGIISTDILGLEPLFPLVVALGVGVALRWRSEIFLALVAVLGAVASFEVYSVATGSILTWLRFFITVIPLTTLALVLFRPWRLLGVALAVAVIGASFAGSWAITGDPAYADSELPFRALAVGTPPYLATVNGAVELPGARAVARWLDAEVTGAGTVLVDNQGNTFTVIAEARRQALFVTPASRNFQSTLEAPYQHGVRYVVTIPPTAGAAYSIVNRYFPGIWRGCVRDTELAFTVGQRGNPSYWRVYRLTGPVSPGNSADAPACRSVSASILPAS